MFRTPKKSFKLSFVFTIVFMAAAAAAAVAVSKQAVVRPVQVETQEEKPRSAGSSEDAASEEREIISKAETVCTDDECKDGFFTLLLVGLDYSGNLTDTIAAVTFDIGNKNVSVLSLPRDTISAAPSGGVHKLNAAYGSGGIERTKLEVENLTGYKFNRYAVVDYDAFEAVIDAVGGVELEIEKDMYKNAGDMVIDLKAGRQTLDGEHALMYMRYRGYAMADLARIEAQRKLISATAKKLARPGTLLKLPTLANTVRDNVRTDMTPGEMIWIGLNYMDMDTESIVYNTLPCTTEYINGISYVIPKEKEALELINEYYNPLKREISALKLAAAPVSKKQDNFEEEPERLPKHDFETVPDWLR